MRYESTTVLDRYGSTTTYACMCHVAFWSLEGDCFHDSPDLKRRETGIYQCAVAGRGGVCLGFLNPLTGETQWNKVATSNDARDRDCRCVLFSGDGMSLFAGASSGELMWVDVRFADRSVAACSWRFVTLLLLSLPRPLPSPTCRFESSACSSRNLLLALV